jgi:hypothetical protein
MLATELWVKCFENLMASTRREQEVASRALRQQPSVAYVDHCRVSSSAILYMLGITRSRPYDAVNVVPRAPACSAP